MAIKISGTTVIDDSRNIQNIGIITATSFVGSGSELTGVGIGTTGSINTSGNITAGVATFRSINVPPVPITFSPAIGATGVNNTSNIIITFNVSVNKGTGNITLRENSAGGTAFSTIAVGDASVTISGGAVTIDPPANIGSGVTTFVVVDAGAFTGLTTTSVNALINTYSFTAAISLLGASYEGGFLICCASPIRWVVSPFSSQVSRTWFSRNDAVTTAQQVSGCTGWFIPTSSQLQNPGFVCRQWWDCFGGSYWGGEDYGCASPCVNPYVHFEAPGGTNNWFKCSTYNVRAFRCVTY